MEESDFKQCGNCIHFQVCSASRSILDVTKELKQKFTFVEWELVVQDPANACTEFIPKIGMVTNKDLR
jgi:hypothetical protein